MQVRGSGRVVFSDARRSKVGGRHVHPEDAEHAGEPSESAAQAAEKTPARIDDGAEEDAADAGAHPSQGLSDTVDRGEGGAGSTGLHGPQVGRRSQGAPDSVGRPGTEPRIGEPDTAGRWPENGVRGQPNGTAGRTGVRAARPDADDQGRGHGTGDAGKQRGGA